LIENILDNKTNLLTEGFILTDPLNPHNKTKETHKIMKGCSDIFIFMIDGGCYNEYQNFCEISKRLNKKVSFSTFYIILFY